MKTMTTKPKLAVPTKAQFRAYLQTLAFNEVSRFCKSGRCPLAQYIADNSTGFPKDTHFLVDNTIRAVDESGIVKGMVATIIAYRAVPEWAKRFIHNVDFLDVQKSKALGYPPTWSAITPYEALVALDFPGKMTVAV